MARLLGEAEALPVPRAPGGIVQAPTDFTSEALTRLGGQLAGAGIDLDRAIAQEQQRVNKARKEEAFTQLRNSALDLTLGEQNGFQRLRGGEAVKTPILQDWLKKFDNSAESLAKGLDNDEQRTEFRAGAHVARGQFTQDILSHVLREKRVYESDVLQATLATERQAAALHWDNPNGALSSLERVRGTVENYGRIAGMDPIVQRATVLEAVSGIHEAVIDQALANGNYDYAQQWYETYKDEMAPALLRKTAIAVEDGAQKQAFNDYQTLFLDSRDSVEGLGTLEESVSRDPALDEARKNILLGRIQNRSEILLNRATREQDDARRELERQVNTLNQLTLQGYEPSSEQMGTLVDAAKGTELQPMVDQMVAGANATRQFRNMPFQAQEMTISQMEALARKDPAKFDVSLVSRFKTIHAAQKRDVTEDPVNFAIRQGLIEADEPVAQPLDLAKPTELGPALAQRLNLARSMARRYQAPVRPLMAAEVDMLKVALDKAGPNEKRGYFGLLAQATGDDFDGYKALMGQLAVDDPVLAIAGIHAGYPEQNRQLAADLMLRGAALLNPKDKAASAAWPMPKGEDDGLMRSVFADTVRDAYAGMPSALTDTYKAARAIYAAKMAEKGDASGAYDPDMWDDSVDLATGGIHEYQGKSTPLPWGMDPDRFEDALQERIRLLVADERVILDEDRLREIPVRAIGDGRYVFNAGDQIVVDKRNQPVIVDLNKPAPLSNVQLRELKKLLDAVGKEPFVKPLVNLP